MIFSMLRGSGLTLDVTTDRQSYSPGEVVRATLRGTATRDLQIQGLTVSLVYAERFEYKTQTRDSDGDRRITTRTATNEADVTVMPITGPALVVPGEIGPYEVELPLPPGPLPGSGEGDITVVRWYVRAKADIPRAPDTNGETSIVVLTPKSAFETRAATMPVTDTSACDLAFEIPDRNVMPGTEIVGSLIIRPREEFSVSGLRVEVVREERVHYDRGNESIKAVSAEPIGQPGSLDFRPGEERRFPFRILVPSGASAYPVQQTPNFSVQWFLKAVLDRRLRGDYEHKLELNVYTAPERAETGPPLS